MAYSTSFPTTLLLLIFIDDKRNRKAYEFVPLKLISEQLGIPRPTLVKIIKSLISKNILESKEGKNGGIRIAKEANEISLLDLFQALEEGNFLFSRVPQINVKGKRPDQVRRGVQLLLDKLHESLEVELEKIKLSSFKESLKDE